MPQVEYATKEDVRKIMDKLELIAEVLTSLIPEIEIEEHEKKKINDILKEMEKGKEYKLKEIWDEI